MVDKDVVKWDILNDNHHLISYSDQGAVPTYKEDKLLHDNNGYRSLQNWSNSNNLSMDAPGLLEDFGLDNLNSLVRSAIKRNDTKVENKKLIKSLVQPKKSCFSSSDHMLWVTYHDKFKNKGLMTPSCLKKHKYYNIINKNIHKEQELYRKYAKDHAKLNIHLYNFTSDFASKYFEEWSKRVYSYTQKLLDEYMLYRVLCIDLFKDYTMTEFKYQHFLAEVKSTKKPFKLVNLRLSQENCESFTKFQSEPTTISEDYNIKLILEKVKVDYVMSISTLKHLLDLDENSSYEIPLLDKKFELASGKTQNCVIFEKALPPKEITSRFQMELYYKQVIKEEMQNSLNSQSSVSVNYLKRKIAQVDGGNDSSSDESSDFGYLNNNSKNKSTNKLSSTKVSMKKVSSPEFSCDSDDSGKLVIDESCDLTSQSKHACNKEQNLHDNVSTFKKDALCFSSADLKEKHKLKTYSCDSSSDLNKAIDIDSEVPIKKPKINIQPDLTHSLSLVSDLNSSESVTTNASTNNFSTFGSIESFQTKMESEKTVKGEHNLSITDISPLNKKTIISSAISSNLNKQVTLSKKAIKDINNSMMMGIINDNCSSTLLPTEPSLPTATELNLSNKNLKNSTYFYSIWRLADKKILVRMKSHGKVFNEKNKVSNVCIRSKLEYQHLNGYEKLTLFEQCSDWIDILMQPKPVKIYRFRICPFKSKVVQTDEIKSFTTVKHNKHCFQPSKACHRLHIVLKKISSELAKVKDKSQNDLISYLIEKETKKSCTITLKLAQKTRPKNLKSSFLNDKTYKISDHYGKNILKIKCNEESFPYHMLDEKIPMPDKPMQIPLTFDIDPDAEPFASKTKFKI